MAEEKKEGRTGIIGAVGTPIQLAALVVLVVEGLLAFLLNKAAPADISLYVSLMVGLLVVTIVSVFFIEFKRIKLREANTIPTTGTAEKPKQSYKWDAFLAAPMAALNDEDFKVKTVKIKEIKKTLEEVCNFQTIFFAGSNMVTKDDFQTADVSIDTDVNALKESRCFIMIYPDKIVSSVLYEAGIALALGKPSFYFGQTDHFPFLMQEANQKFSYVKIHEAGSLDDIIKMIRNNKSDLFKIDGNKSLDCD